MSDQPNTTPAVKAAPTRTEFAATLLDLDKGRVHDDMTDRLAELVEAVCHTAKKGSVTLKISVEPLDASTFEDDGTLVFSGDVKLDVPRLTRAPSIFYATGVDGQVTRDAPRNDPRD